MPDLAIPQYLLIANSIWKPGTATTGSKQSLKSGYCLSTPDSLRTTSYTTYGCMSIQCVGDSGSSLYGVMRSMLGWGATCRGFESRVLLLFFWNFFSFVFVLLLTFYCEFRFQIGELTYPGSLQERKKKVLLNSLHENQRVANRGVNSNTR